MDRSMTDPFAKLTHVSPGRPTGEILRQFFEQHPAADPAIMTSNLAGNAGRVAAEAVMV